MTGGENESTPAADNEDMEAGEAEPATAAPAGELVYENRAFRVFELPDGRHRLIHAESGRHWGEWEADVDGNGFWRALQQADVSTGKARPAGPGKRRR